MNRLAYCVFAFGLKDEGERNVFTLNRELLYAPFPARLYGAERQNGVPISLAIWVQGSALDQHGQDRIETYLLEALERSGYVAEEA